jgi:hypothetical protein
VTTDQVLECVRARNLTVVVRDGRPELCGKKQLMTPTLLRVLRHHRAEIIRRLTPREWLWRTGHTYTEDPRDARFGDRDHHAAGAWWWQLRGETEWHGVSDRPGENLPAGVIPWEPSGSSPWEGDAR